MEPEVVTHVLRWQPNPNFAPLEFQLASIFGGTTPA
jgi:hypothetical protein